MLHLRSERLAYGISVIGEGMLPSDDWFLLPPRETLALPITLSVPVAEFRAVQVSAVNATGRERISLAVSGEGR